MGSYGEAHVVRPVGNVPFTPEMIQIYGYSYRQGATSGSVVSNNVIGYVRALGLWNPALTDAEMITLKVFGLDISRQVLKHIRW